MSAVWFITGAGRGLGWIAREALHAELAPLGIHVALIEPGVFRTDFLAASSLVRAGQTIDDYAGTAGATRSRADENNQAQPGDPAKAAVAIVDLSCAADAPLRLQLGADSVARIERKLALVAEELEAWRGVAVSAGIEA